MSDLSSSVLNDQSVSTDSEESFLVQQINKSQLFNSSTNSSNSSKKRKSFFRESYLDEFGKDHSFSVYQDAVKNETIDESRDISNISKLSSLDAEKIKNMNNRPGSILGELSLNGTSEALPDLSRKSSSKRKSRYELHYQNVPVPQSQRNSFIAVTPLNDNVDNFPPPFKTPEIPAPKPPTHSQHDAITDIISAYRDDDIPKSETRQPSNDLIDALPIQKPFNIQPKPIEKERSTSNSSSKTYRSARSDFSTRRSLLNFEMTRKKQFGTPHLLINSSASNSPFTPGSATFSSDKHSLSSPPLVQSPYLEKVHSTAQAPTESRQEPDKLRSTVPFKRGPDILKTLKVQEVKKPAFSDSHSEESLDIHEDEKKSYLTSNYDNEHPYNDELLEKIYYYRRQPEVNQPKTSTGLIWFIYFISFLVPPLFFFLGLGLLDRYVSQYRISPGIKKLSLFTGIFVLIVSCALIGVGFGYGIHEASIR